MERPPRFLDRITVEENHQRFIRRAVEHERVWSVRTETGPIVVDSDADEEGEEEPRVVYLFFSDEPYAKRVLRESWPDFPDYRTEEISLFDFLFRWLPGMHDDNHLVGTNWTGDLIGLEVEPADVQQQLKAQMSDELKAHYEALFVAADKEEPE
jgi:hypothetical protein